MRVKLCAFLALLSLALLLTSSARAVTVSIAGEHISVDVPSGWSYERNYTSGGWMYDLYMEGPATSSGLLPPLAIIDGTSWTGSITSSTLYAEMEREIEDFRDDPDVTDVVILIPPTNTTQSGLKAIDCTVRMTLYNISMTSREIIMASSDWDRAWSIVFFDETADWNSVQSSFSFILASLVIEEKESSDIGTLLIVGIVIALVVIVVVAVLLLRRKKEPALYPLMPPPQYQQPPQPPAPPPPPP